ncbi:MAG: TRAP transporter small permease subunit [Halieaceae bacterium]|jgi:TRAP-type mannitol/chloroaromatic compound transport system permease small subunit|nr:TRAP transporter small permease subunit [Halieaceae bacterium]
MAIRNLPDTRLSRIIDPLLDRVGRAASWLWLVLLLVIVGNVLLRYVFGEGRVELEELQWHLYSLGFLLGLAYAFQADAHIRVDVLSERFSARTRAWLELYGLLLALLPFIALVLVYSLPFVWRSFELSEVSQAAGGLPFRWAIKAALPLGFLLLLLGALSRLSRVWSFLFGAPPEHRP